MRWSDVTHLHHAQHSEADRDKPIAHGLRLRRTPDGYETIHIERGCGGRVERVSEQSILDVYRCEKCAQRIEIGSGVRIALEKEELAAESRELAPREEDLNVAQISAWLQKKQAP